MEESTIITEWRHPEVTEAFFDSIEHAYRLVPSWVQLARYLNRSYITMMRWSKRRNPPRDDETCRAIMTLVTSLQQMTEVERRRL